MIYSFRHPKFIELKKRRITALARVPRASRLVSAPKELQIGTVWIDEQQFVNIWTGTAWMKISDTPEELRERLELAEFHQRIPLIDPPSVRWFAEPQQMTYTPLPTIEAPKLLSFLHKAISDAGLRRTKL